MLDEKHIDKEKVKLKAEAREEIRDLLDFGTEEELLQKPRLGT
jgi:hypothetical protein